MWKRRVLYGLGVVLLAILVTLVVWQTSFRLGDFAPSSPTQTLLFWAVSTLIFLLMVILGFMLVRTGVNLYIERQSNREGSRIRTKLVIGALALSILPVFFLVLFSWGVLNRNLLTWFSRPGEGIKQDLVEVAGSIDRTVQEKAQAQANWFSALPEIRDALGPAPQNGFFKRKCRENSIDRLTIQRADGTSIPLCMGPTDLDTMFTARAPILADNRVIALLALSTRMPADLAEKRRDIEAQVHEYDQLSANRRYIRTLYTALLLLISLFILFVAVWIALKLARQISGPISALLGAAGEIRRGNLGHRVHVAAIDELATLVRAFNEMTRELEANSRELESRRRFTEAILESIPTGVISLSSDGGIQRVNRALKGIFSEETIQRAVRLEDLFSREDTAEIKYLMKRARRTGFAASQLEFQLQRQMLHLAVTVSALDDTVRPGFVLVLEDTSELLRAQKSAAWHEVARRIAHELKNPLTPISLCAERIGRQLDRGASTSPAEAQRILRECSTTILKEVQSVKTLVDEFSQFSRFPAAHPVPCDLNEIIHNALAVFAGRLGGIEVRLETAANLPVVNVDPDQFKRVVVNLVDNAAEAMQESLVKSLVVKTAAISPDTVEIVIADTGCGVSPEDKEKLFLPYFSTKGRGTGLGLAIVNRILADHGAAIRVEDNQPIGACFIVEIPTAVPETDSGLYARKAEEEAPIAETGR
ncbi:MAG: sensor histidine kinase [Bryobacteraceae bacterium]